MLRMVHVLVLDPPQTFLVEESINVAHCVESSTVEMVIVPLCVNLGLQISVTCTCAVRDVPEKQCVGSKYTYMYIHVHVRRGAAVWVAVALCQC